MAVSSVFPIPPAAAGIWPQLAITRLEPKFSLGGGLPERQNRRG